VSLGAGVFLLAAALFEAHCLPPERARYLESDLEGCKRLGLMAPGLVFLVGGLALASSRCPQPFAAARTSACTQASDATGANLLLGSLPPLSTSLSPRAAYMRAVQTAAALGWRVTWSAPEARRFNATAAVGSLPFDGVLEVSVVVRPHLEPSVAALEAEAGLAGPRATEAVDGQRGPPEGPESPTAEARTKVATGKAYASPILSVVHMCSSSRGRARDFGLNAASIHRFERRFELISKA